MPFNPSVVDRSGEILASGISKGFGAIGDAITKYQDDKKDAESADATFKMMLPIMQKAGVPIDPKMIEKFGSASGSQKTALLGGMTKAFGAHMAQQQMAESTAAAKRADEHLGMDRAAGVRAQGEYDYKQGQRKAGGEMMQDFTPGTGGNNWAGSPDYTGTNTPPKFTPEAFMASAAKHGVSPEQALPILKLMMEGQGNQAPFFTRAEADQAKEIAPGFMRAVIGPNNSQIIPDMRNAGQAVPITGPGGEELGYGLPSRSGVQPLRTGDVTEKDQFAALTAEKRALLAAKSRVFNDPEGKNWKPFDDAIAQLDARLKELQAGDKKPAKTGAIKYKLVNGQLQQATE